MQDLTQLLEARAVDLDVPDMGYWQVEVNSSHIRVKAVTREAAADQAGGWVLAQGLVNAILTLGYKMKFRCEIGILGASFDDEAEGAPRAWHGQVNLGLQKA
jgi:hypothetical protein